MLYFGISVPNTGVLELLHPNSEVTRSPNFNTQNQASFTDLHACGGWREPYCRSVQETRSTKSISQFYLWTTTYRIKITGECSMSRGHSAPQGDQLTGWPGRDHQEHPGETPLRGLDEAQVSFPSWRQKTKNKRRLQKLWSGSFELRFCNKNCKIALTLHV